MNSKAISSIFDPGKPARTLKNAKAAREKITDLFTFHATGYQLSMLDWKDGRDRFRCLPAAIFPHCTLRKPEDLFLKEKFTQHPGTRYKTGSAVRSLVADVCRMIPCIVPRHGRFMAGTPRKALSRLLSGRNSSCCTGCLVTGSVFDAPVVCAGAVPDARV